MKMQVIGRKRIGYKSRKGFTLSEILISVGLMAFVATAAIGGLVILNNAKEAIKKQEQAEMIMIATVGYLREDLNCCTDPHTMDCSINAGLYDLSKTGDNTTIFTSDNESKFGSDFFQLSSMGLRYTNVIIRNAADETIGTAVCGGPRVQYCNSNADPDYNGICVGIIYDSVSAPVPVNPGVTIGDGFNSGFYTRRKYIIAQNIMQGTGMYSRIKDGMITWNDTDKLFEFTIEVVDEITNEVVLSQYVEVCPDTLLPNAPYNP